MGRNNARSGRGTAVDDNPEFLQSRRHGGHDPNAAEERERLRLESLKGTHINGVPWETWQAEAGELAASRMVYQITDEGLAEQRKRDSKKVDRLPGTGKEARDAEDKAVLAYKSALGTGADELISEADPLNNPLKRYVPAGFSGLWLSKSAIDKYGTVRNRMQYIPCKDEKGETVKQGGMLLYMVPTKLKRQSDAYFAGLSDAKTRGIIDRVKEKSDRVLQAAGVSPQERRRQLREQDDPMRGIEVEDAQDAAGDMGQFDTEVDGSGAGDGISSLLAADPRDLAIDLGDTDDGGDGALGNE